MKPSLGAVFVASLVSLGGCASSPDPAFYELARFDKQPAEVRPKLLLPFDAYVVGVEKDNASRVGEVRECTPGFAGGDCLDIEAPYFADRPTLRDNIRSKYLNQHRPTFISHVARFDGSEAPCFLVNRHDSARPCTPGAGPLPGDTPVTQSFAALRRLGEDLDVRLAQLKPSHVLVYAMGWNTQQIETLDNFRRLAAHLTDAAREAGDTTFRPLLIGLTWPSTGSPLIAASDYGIKAKDADETGAIWENLLVNRELRRLKPRHDFRLIVVGHSFGARLTSRAVFSGPLVGASEEPVVDLLIGLQGAYSYQRYLAAESGDSPEGREGAPYRDHGRLAGMVALTSSRWDTAVTQALHGPYFVGSAEVFQRTQSDDLSEWFVHQTVSADGRLPVTPRCDPKRVLMIDASAVIVGNEPGTSGGAHSVIYTPHIGRLSHQLIRACSR